MTPDLDDDLRNAITDVLIRYATAIDYRDWDLFRTCFSEDCDLDYGDIGHWHGVDDATRWMADTHDPLGPTLHRITNIAIAPAAGGVTARSTVHAILVMPDGSAAIHAYGRYEDDLFGQLGTWRISRRRFTLAATEVHQPVVAPQSVPHPPDAR